MIFQTVKEVMDWATYWKVNVLRNKDVEYTVSSVQGSEQSQSTVSYSFVWKLMATCILLKVGDYMASDIFIFSFALSVVSPRNPFFLGLVVVQRCFPKQTFRKRVNGNMRCLPVRFLSFEVPKAAHTRYTYNMQWLKISFPELASTPVDAIYQENEVWQTIY